MLLHLHLHLQSRTTPAGRWQAALHTQGLRMSASRIRRVWPPVANCITTCCARAAAVNAVLSVRLRQGLHELEGRLAESEHQRRLLEIDLAKQQQRAAAERQQAQVRIAP